MTLLILPGSKGRYKQPVRPNRTEWLLPSKAKKIIPVLVEFSGGVTYNTTDKTRKNTFQDKFANNLVDT
ncbi:hypothetical protein INT45_012163, partial [Circinella minor]